MAMWAQGDAVLVPNPSYPVHPYGFVIVDADVRHVPLIKNGNFFNELELMISNSWPKPKVIVAKPSGKPYDRVRRFVFLRKAIAFAKEHKIWVVQDLAYADLVFGVHKVPSILQVPGAK